MRPAGAHDHRPGRGGAALRVALTLAAALFAVSACQEVTEETLDDYGDQVNLGKADSATGPKPEVYRLARLAAAAAHSELSGLSNKLAILDFSLSSSKKRLWVIDLDTEQVLYNTYAAHGQNSGSLCTASEFSNRDGSHMSSIGLYRCAEIGTGNSVGYYVALDGLDPGYNSNARDRQIVLHGAAYVSSSYRASHDGCCGRSWGCPAVDKGLVHKIADTLSGGGLLFAYYPDDDWLASSRWLQDSGEPPPSGQDAGTGGGEVDGGTGGGSCSVESQGASGANGDPCSVPAETWRCAWLPSFDAWGSQVCRNHKWVTVNLNIADCDACCGEYSSACK